MFSRRAPGRDAEIASAAWTRQASTVCGSTSPWWASMQWMTASLSRYLRAMSTPMVTWLPSTSWSMDLPMSCSRPARLATFTSTPSSLASRPAMWETSMEWFSTF